MEFNATPSGYSDRGGERGGGGKFRKPPSRKPPSAPYDRPPSSRSGWLSKLADPAYRIISGSAKRILPSFITNAIASSSPPLIQQIHDEEDPATIQGVEDDKCSPSYVISRSTEGDEGDPSLGKLTAISHGEKLEEENLPNSSDNAEISRIEQLMQRKTFSRDEIMRLTEILKSRVTGEQENKPSRTDEVDTRVIGEQESKPSRTDEVDAGRFHLTHETPRRPNYEKHDEADIALPGTSTPLPHVHVQDDVGASPIDIARAYMGSRRLEKGCDSYGFVSKGEQAPENRFFPPSPKPSTCWPASMVQGQRGYLTPRNQRGYGLVDFPRTPYSRTVLPKSRDGSQSQADNRWLDLSVKLSQQSQSSNSQEKTRTDLPNLSYGSAGPIRRMHNKFVTESRPRRSIFLNSANAGKNLEAGETSGVSKNHQSVERTAGSSEEVMPLRSSSNETARKIFEQLNRHKPTPAEKAAESKLASEWKKSPESEASDATPSGKRMRSPDLGVFGVRRNHGLAEQTTREVDTVADTSAKASSMDGISVSITEANSVPSFTLRGAASQVQSASHSPSLREVEDSINTDYGQKDKGVTPQWPSHNQSNGQKATTSSNSAGVKLPRNAPGQATGTRPNLPSIFINKPNPRKSTSVDNGFGFTFQVPASSSAFSEPPTPSIMPSSSTIPLFSFGAEKSAERLVYSFPSTSNASTPVDASDLKFDFGADSKSRLSFSAVGKALC